GLFPCLSPDGSKLAYLCSDNPWEVYILDLEHGTKPVRRQGGKARPNGDANGMAWSADGKTLYFASDFAAAANSVTTSLYALSADGSSQRKIWDALDERTYRAVHPSPDGKSLLVACGATKVTSEAYLVAADGSDMKAFPDECYLPATSWSEDSKRIYVWRPTILLSCRPDGSDQKTLLEAEFNYAFWQPRGDK